MPPDQIVGILRTGHHGALCAQRNIGHHISGRFVEVTGALTHAYYGAGDHTIASLEGAGCTTAAPRINDRGFLEQHLTIGGNLRGPAFLTSSGADLPPGQIVHPAGAAQHSDARADGQIDDHIGGRLIGITRRTTHTRDINRLQGITSLKITRRAATCTAVTRQQAQQFHPGRRGPRHPTD